MNVRRKEVFEAFRFVKPKNSEEEFMGRAVLTETVLEKVIEEVEIDGEKVKTEKEVPVQKAFILWPVTPTLVKKVYEGEWFVKDADGCVVTMSDEKFQKEFEKV